MNRFLAIFFVLLSTCALSFAQQWQVAPGSYTVTQDNPPYDRFTLRLAQGGVTLWESGTQTIANTDDVTVPIPPQILSSSATVTLFRALRYNPTGNNPSWFGEQNVGTWTPTAYTPPPSITSSLAVSGMTDVAFAYTITATGSPTSYSCSAGLPPGVDFNSGSGTLTGVPTEAGVYSVVIGASNANGSDAETLVITISANQDPCAPTSAPPESYYDHQITVPLENPADHDQYFRIVTYRAVHSRQRNEAGQCVDVWEMGPQLSEQEILLVGKGKASVLLKEPDKFFYKIFKLTLHPTPDGGGEQTWDPLEPDGPKPQDADGNDVPEVGSSTPIEPPPEAPPQTEPDTGVPGSSTVTGAGGVDSPPPPVANEERPASVNDTASHNAADDARQKELRGELQRLGQIGSQGNKQSAGHAQTAHNDAKGIKDAVGSLKDAISGLKGGADDGKDAETGTGESVSNSPGVGELVSNLGNIMDALGDLSEGWENSIPDDAGFVLTVDWLPHGQTVQWTAPPALNYVAGIAKAALSVLLLWYFTLAVVREVKGAFA